MGKSLAFAVLLLVLTPAVQAQPAPFRRVGHFIAHHQVLVLNTALDLAIGAQSSAAYYCRAKINDCYYAPTLTGVPSKNNILWEGAVVGAGINLANYFWHKEYPHNYLEWFWTAPLVAVEAATVGQNFNPNNKNPFNSARWRRENVK